MPVALAARRSRRLARAALLGALFAIAAGACASGAPAAPGAAPLPAPGAAVRIHDTRRGAATDVGTMTADLARADAVFIGEQHDDVPTHRLQLAVLEALARQDVRVVLALEMFERDVQPLLDRYLAGHATEAELLAGARPWPNYARDYRPLVELARAQGWPVVASNAPRPLASAVSRAGLALLGTLAAADRAHVARDVRCGDSAYRRKFEAQMGAAASHGAAGVAAGHAAPSTVGRYYEAQCVKDETMAESVVAAMRPGVVVVHVNGRFHSDGRLGAVERVQRRRPTARIVVISAVPAVDRAAAAAMGAAGDYVVLTGGAP